MRMKETAMLPSEQVTAGIDAGSGAVKLVIASSKGGDQPTILFKACERIRRRNVHELVRRAFDEACAQQGISQRDLVYVASTGDGEAAPFATGHFYSMTTHARGALFLQPKARAVLDIGALHARAIKFDDRSKVLSHRMTSQCASGSGQFLENIARYLGVPLEEVGELSMQAQQSEQVSGICAVLAETDVINMVSRGVPTSHILKGIHVSIAARLARLVRAIKVQGALLVSGGLALDAGLGAALREAFEADKGERLEVLTHPDSIYAGAIGSALLGAYRHVQLQRRGRAPADLRAAEVFPARTPAVE
jgi:benzoyl-CoA reductase subunit D